MRTLLDYWRGGYDWSEKERELNEYPQFISQINNLYIHFFHIPGSNRNAAPLLLSHGWSDSFLRYAKTFPLLKEFDLIVPSLPGFAFSTLPKKSYINNAEIAEIWHTLMTDVLGYKKYIAAGGDMGRGVTCYLAANYPDELMGIHLTDAGFAGDLVSAPDNELTSAELDYKRRAAEWMRNEGAYINIQSTKPQTLAYSLSGSPVGIAAWVTEKYHSWSEPGLLKKDDLLDCLTLYWMTDTASRSIRNYHGNAFTLPPLKKITSPTAFAFFPYDILPAPIEWIEKNFPVVMKTNMPRGGHFTALEQPIPYAENISEFVKQIW